MDILQVLKDRYTTKVYDPTKKISTDDFEKIKTLLQMSPSSTNLQPWHFVIAETDEGKQRFAKATQGLFAFNAAKVLDASHVVAFCAKIDATKEHIRSIVDQEDKDGRFASEELKNKNHNARTMFANIHKHDFKDQQHWMEKQVYLNMGNFLLGVAALGIDATPIEGIDTKAFDIEFDMREKNLTCVAFIALGYRASDDFNAKLPKSRLPQSEIISIY